MRIRFPTKTSLLIARLRTAVAFGLCAVALSAQAWNAGGHRLVAGIAWERMTPSVRAKAAHLLRAHPDHARWQQMAGGAEDGRLIFIAASTWPDEIRKDSRFYTAGKEEPTPLLAGFPDMLRHSDWHYEARLLNPAEGDAPNRPPSGAIGKALVSQATHLRGSQSEYAAYALPWLIHLVGDVHQPLHVSLRLDAAGNWDRLGSRQSVRNPMASRKPVTTLHEFWDDLPGSVRLGSDALEARIDALTARYPQPPKLLTPEDWLSESWQLARSVGYPAGRGQPLEIDAVFLDRSREVADRRVAEAGYRLGAWLNQLLGGKAQ